MASDFPYGVYVGLYISTPEEMKKAYGKTVQEEIREYRMKTLDEFVKSWNVQYFFNYKFKWDLPKLCDLLPGLNNLIDHGFGFVDTEGNPFLLLQPYGGNPEEFRKKNKVCKYVKVWKGGFHNPEAYAVVVSGDFLTYLETNIEDFHYCKEWRKKKHYTDYDKLWLEHITRISDVHHGAK